MKALAYLFLFLLILGGIVFGFFTMTTPDIRQTTVIRPLTPKDAFGTPPAPKPLSTTTPAAPTAAATAPLSDE